LRRARGEYARRTGALYENLPCGSFPATRCKDDGFCRNVACAVSVDKVNREAVFGFFDFRDEGQKFDFDVGFKKFIDEPFGVFRSRKFFLESDKSEAVVYALFQNTAEFRLALDK